MKFKNTYIMLLLLLLLGGYVYYFEIRGDKIRQEKEASAKKIFHIEQDTVSAVWLYHPADTMAFKKELKREGEKWYLTAPVEDITDRFTVDGMVREITDALNEGVIADSGQNAAEYGLDPPKALVKFQTNKGYLDSLRVGIENLTGSYVYAQRFPGTAIFLAGKMLGDYAVKKTPLDFRDREVFKYERREVNQYVISNPNGTFKMKKTGEEWDMLEPLQERADKDGLDNIINQILKTRAEKFIDAQILDLKKYGLDSPKIRLDIWIGDINAQRTFIVGKRATDDDAGGSYNVHYYAKDEGRKTVFTIDSVLVNRLMTDLSALRNKRAAVFSRDSIDQITFDYGDSAITCGKDTTKEWLMIKPIQEKVKGWKVNGALSDLENMKIVKFLMYDEKGKTQYGFSKPQVTIIVKDKEKEIGRYVFGKKSEDNIYFLDGARKKMFLVSGKEINNFIFAVSDIVEESPKTIDTTSTNK